MDCTIFYSWQSDLDHKTNRYFIQNALEKAAKSIRKDDSIQIVPRVDEGTKGIAGAPDIAYIIFSKIANADIFVCDVSIINRGSKFRKTPNPNVMIEVGYAKHALPFERHIMVFNTAFGDFKNIPFDLQGTRSISYKLFGNETEQERLIVRRNLEKDLENAVRSILSNIELKKSTASKLRLQLVQNDEYSEDITVDQTQGYVYPFGISLQNTTQGSIPAEKIDIYLEIRAVMENIQQKPAFFIEENYRETMVGWSERRSEITYDKPAVLIFRDDQERCSFGHPRDWLGFALYLREKVSGYFEIRYRVTSSIPYTTSDGVLRINMT